MKPYSKYKDSDIEWLEEIPEHWEIFPIKAITTRRFENNRPDMTLLSVYRDYGVIPKDSRDDNHNRPSLDLTNYRVVRKNDLVLNKMKTWQGSLAVSSYDGIVSPAYIVCKLNNCVYPPFIHYLLRSPRYIEQYIRYSYGIRPDQWDMHYDDFKLLPALLPSLSEQRNIALYLDHKTSQIDTLIEKKQKLIELLKEYRTAIINQAVTKGLNPDVPMKDSGIEWLGEVPEHWEVKKLKYLGDNLIGITYSPTDVVTKANGILVLRASNIKNGKPDYSDCVYVNIKVPDELITRRGDILLCARSGSADLVGKNICIDETNEGVTFGAFMTIYRSMYWRFFSHFFNSEIFKSQSGLFKTSTINQLTNDTLRNMKVAFPKTIDEQILIASYLDRKTYQINSLIEEQQKLIAFLKEYRTTLISDVVTGKIDVRGEI